jgi:hypothetical protein
MIDCRDRASHPFVVQEMAVPAGLRRLFEEMFTTANTLRQLGTPDDDPHRPREERLDPCAVDEEAIEHSSLFAIMGDDGAAGALELAGGAQDDHGDGAICVRWPALRESALFDKQLELLRQLVDAEGRSRTVLPNPMWKPLTEKIESLLDGNLRGAPLTVHPLGGCAMAAIASEGVVNHRGQVFDPCRPGKLYSGLVVLDGAIVPGALGINPALTIAALALRATRLLRAEWQVTEWPTVERPQVRKRPIHHEVRFVARPPAQFEVLERLSGLVWVRLPGQWLPRRRVVELTLHFQPRTLSSLIGPLQRSLEAGPKSRMRVYTVQGYRKACRWTVNRPDAERRRERAALIAVDAAGTLRILDREASTPFRRALWAFVGYMLNRGVRDIVNFLLRRIAERDRRPMKGAQRLKDAWRLASRAGEVRRLE